MWYQIFLWALFSSMFVHIIAALVALCRLRRHSIGRWYAMLILVMGVVGPCTGGVLTSKNHMHYCKNHMHYFVEILLFSLAPRQISTT